MNLIFTFFIKIFIIRMVMNMKKTFLSLKIYEWIYLVFWCVLISILSLFNKSSIFAIMSSVFGIIAAVLNIKNNRYAFFFFALYASSYGIIAFINHNYGEGILNLFYNTPLYIFTIYNLFFSKKVKEGNSSIKALSSKEWIIIAIIIPLVSVVYGFVLSRFENSNLPYINALATGFAIISSFLASRRNKDQWYFWIGYALVVVYIWLYSQGERVYLFLNIFYLLNNSLGLYLWMKAYKKERLESNN